MDRPRPSSPIDACDRRAWIRAALGGLVATNLLRGVEPTPDDASEVEVIGRKAGLEGFGRAETAHYLGLGNAPAAFRAESVATCETLAEDFLKHFREKGFDDLTLPKSRLTLVVLADARSFGLFTGEKQDQAIGGHYELDTNRLVTFDFRGDQAGLAIAAERVNTIVLIHEATHQLTFNAGMLDRQGDFPLAICEGLATYGEVWRPRRKGVIGQVNTDRLKGLKIAFDRGDSWIPVEKLLVEDDLMDGEATRDVAYAESWLLIHMHMKSPAKLPKLRAYLAAIKGRRDPKRRLEDARQHLGDLEKLDAELRRYRSRPTGK
jgi:hypothetical protein